MKNITELSTLEYFEPIEGLKAKLKHTENQTYAFWEIKKGTLLPEHNHSNEQVSFVTKGELELTIDREVTLLTKGMIAVIPPYANHSAKAITDVELTDVFTPVRTDFPTYKKEKYHSNGDKKTKLDRP